jgi:hypothetical protein
LDLTKTNWARPKQLVLDRNYFDSPKYFGPIERQGRKQGKKALPDELDWQSYLAGRYVAQNAVHRVISIS